MRIDYSARRPVWSGLGTDITGCRSINEALECSGLDFTVRQTDVYTDDICPVRFEGLKANVKDDGTPLGIVSGKYRIVQNEDAFAFVDELAGEGLKFERAGGLQGGRKTFILAKLPDRYIISGEAIAPYIVFMNSFDGSSSVRVFTTPLRMICMNMLHLALSKAARSWSAIHCGDIEHKLEDARNTLLYADKYMHALGEEIEELKHIHLSDAKVIELVDELYPVSEGMTDVQRRNVGIKRLEVLERYHHAPDLVMLKKDGFRFINSVSDAACHSEPIKRRENYRENLFLRSVEGDPLIDRALRLVHAA